MKELKKKFYTINEKGEQVEIKITPEGSMWILAYGYDTVMEWKRIRKEQGIDNPSDMNFATANPGDHTEPNK